jgi:hypothetical protein
MIGELPMEFVPLGPAKMDEQRAADEEGEPSYNDGADDGQYIMMQGGCPWPELWGVFWATKPVLGREKRGINSCPPLRVIGS